MKKIIIFYVCFAAALLLEASDANAIGLGFYGSLGGDRSATWSEDNDVGILSSSYSEKTKTGHRSAGIAFDTAVAQNSLLNYHCNLGYDSFTLKTANHGNKVTIGGPMISGGVGLGVMRTERYRLWMGPELRIAFPKNDRSNIEFAGVGVGPVLGMNFHSSTKVSFVVKTGCLFMQYDNGGDQSVTTITERLIYVNIGILFRSFKDMY